MQVINYRIVKPVIILSTIIFVLVFLQFLIAGNSPHLNADNFYPDGDIDQCKLASTVGIGYELQNSSRILYDQSQVSGYHASWLTNHDFHDVASSTYPDAHRFVGVADAVSVPPNSIVRFASYFWNYSGHDIHLKSMQFFLNYGQRTQNDLSSIGANYHTDGTIRFGSNDIYSRSGKQITVPSIPAIPNRTDKNGNIIYSFVTFTPIELLSRNVTYEINESFEVVLNFNSSIRNNYAERICDIEYINKPVENSGIEYRQTICVDAGETYSLNYSINLGNDYEAQIDLSPSELSIKNPIYATMASAYKDSRDYYNFDARSLYLYRNDLPNHFWFDYQPSWGQISTPVGRVKIIPYKYIGQPNQLVLPYKVLLKKEVVEDRVYAPGENIRFRISIENQGPNIRDININDKFPGVLDILDVSEGLSGKEYQYNLDSLKNAELNVRELSFKISEESEYYHEGINAFANYVETVTYKEATEVLFYVELQTEEPDPDDNDGSEDGSKQGGNYTGGGEDDSSVEGSSTQTSQSKQSYSPESFPTNFLPGFPFEDTLISGRLIAGLASLMGVGVVGFISGLIGIWLMNRK